MKKITVVLFGFLLFGAGGLFASDNRPIGVFDSGTGGLKVLEKKPKAHLEKPPVRTALFNGRDLAGWTAVIDHDVTGGYSACEPTWFVTNGTIRTTGTPFGYLRTKREDFGDCKFHVEYRWWRETPKPNSGVFVRIAKEYGTFLPTCIENQLCRGSAGYVLGLAGFRFDGAAPRDVFDPKKPLSGISVVPRKGADVEMAVGEWNTLEVELKGDTLVNTVNGVELNRVSGISASKGAIALQAEGGAVEFRDIWVEETGEQPPELREAEAQKASEPKISRNALCPCGSGKKYKLCCGKDK